MDADKVKKLEREALWYFVLDGALTIALTAMAAYWWGLRGAVFFYGVHCMYNMRVGSRRVAEELRWARVDVVAITNTKTLSEFIDRGGIRGGR